MKRKIAVVTFNLGGPDRPESVQPFLLNLFNDSAIIGLPNPFRWLLAHFISWRRAPVARKIYAHLGGGSPLLKLTGEQCLTLEDRLNRDHPDAAYRVFVAMRYWHPMSLETADHVGSWQPDEIVLLPLYPQYSTTTTGSSLVAWERAAQAVGLMAETRAICCYPENTGWIMAQAELLGQALTDWQESHPLRVLFSAHGLPKKIIAGGDPYQWQVERTSQAILDRLSHDGFADFESVVCYQSRVGPLEWIGPSTDDEIIRAGHEERGVIVVPVAFVSEHSETLVELDIEYAELAASCGVPRYVRVPAVGNHRHFISGLADLLAKVREGTQRICSDVPHRRCPSACQKCPLNQS